MKKCFVLLCLLAFCGILAGCGTHTDQSASGPSAVNAAALFHREHDSKNDLIKFYNIDWLAGPETVRQAFVKDYGEDAFMMGELGHTYNYGEGGVSAPLFTHRIEGIEGNHYKPLEWEIGGCKVDYILLYFQHNPDVPEDRVTDRDVYLYRGVYQFLPPEKEQVYALRDRLNELYGASEDGYFKNVSRDQYILLDRLWTDGNGNKIELYYSAYDGRDPGMNLTYTCGDMSDYMAQIIKKLQEKKKLEEISNDKL